MLNKKQIEVLKKLYYDRNTTVVDITKIFKISKKTLYNYLNEAEEDATS